MKKCKLVAFAVRAATGMASALGFSGITALAKRLAMLAVYAVAEASVQELWYRLVAG